ncbi:MAG: hypothetical protein VX519_01310 [Myxococcota bacterium]|nr:hypothetical protein [Myxococcota bacterium]
MSSSEEIDINQIEHEALAQLEEEHRRRVVSMERRRARAEERRTTGNNSGQEATINDIQDRVRQQFYENHNYKRYVDSRGNAHWLIAEEYEWRMKHRKRSQKHRSGYSGIGKRQMRMRMVNIAVVVVAILAGLMVLHESM